MVVNPNWDGDWERNYFPNHGTDGVLAMRVDSVVTVCDEPGRFRALFYSEELVSSAGMHFTLFAEPTHTREDIATAKRKLRSDRDVVSIAVVRITEWIGGRKELQNA
jgi:hypothetical protein